ncbi:aldehyde dehydrogenase (NADP(+)) [Bowmanella dokdonensis]|uniref:Aldehyde dehydrogenase (NADP(+)) n=1 Tax=Bowmanella dokdonensis TaxID=751969 RepID=A0A939DMC8_9ALTE|nr:aldehyde dehydrogenase (NADP(+)) [Bowmanella dokdonensis]MBN7825234.1 aldehyde dehydrogenase (NADP(+)) [Bowmanella dokdonensis]
MISGQHFIAGRWQGRPLAHNQSFNPATNRALDWHFAEADLADLAQITELAHSAFQEYRRVSPSSRAAFLNCIADEIEALGSTLVEVVNLETALPQARVENERTRTCNQLRLFADNLLSQDMEIRDPALPDRKPLPRPALRLTQIPLGPVVVFGASNFPLAFSTAGGDTAAALAAGCPVIFKGHNAHPATCELIARAIDKAIRHCAMPEGVFTLVHARQHAFSESLIAQPKVKAVAFTGSVKLGMHFAGIIQQRPEPIPFYGELGSQNPVFALPDYLQDNLPAFADALIQSVTMGQGQFCTRPGLVFVVADTTYPGLCQALAERLANCSSGPMLTAKIAQGYRHQSAAWQQCAGVELLAQGQGEETGCHGRPRLFASDAEAFLQHPELREEIFGPASLLVRCKDVTQMQMLATTLAGQLTATLYASETEWKAQSVLLQELELKAGRIIAGQMPTGVEVCHSMQHGGPFPASSDSRYTAVGSQAIRRFLRPLCYQNLSDSLSE